MSDSGYIEEKQAQFERDRQAYEAQSPDRQKWAGRLAASGFVARRVFVTTTRGVVGAFEFAFNVGLRLPYLLIGRGIRALANGAVFGAKLGVKGARRLGEASLELGDKTAKKLGRDAKRLRHWKQALPFWESRTIEAIDRNWKQVKKDMVQWKLRAGEYVERYGAIPLYRGTQWLFDPKTPSGKPLFINDRINKTIGLCLAGAAFFGLTIGLSKIAVMGKIWHLKFAKSFVHDTSPVFIRMLKQAAFHPMLTAGVTAVKFVTLPAIAAARRALKTSPFNQAVAYEYNRRLNEKDALKAEKKAARPATPAKGKTSAMARYLQKKSLSFLEKFITHIVEKAAPEHYEARIRHYAEKRKKRVGKAATPDLPPPALNSNPTADTLESAFNPAAEPEKPQASPDRDPGQDLNSTTTPRLRK